LKGVNGFGQNGKIDILQGAIVLVAANVNREADRRFV
jgi:hypothetical protein